MTRAIIDGVEIGVLERITIRPCDKLLITCDRPLRPEVACRIRKELSEWSGLNSKQVIVLDGGIEMKVVSSK